MRLMGSTRIKRRVSFFGAVAASLSIVTPASAGPIATAAEQYGKAAEGLSEAGVKALSSDFRADSRRRFLEKDLQVLLLQAAYDRKSADAVPGRIELLCMPQLGRKKIQDNVAAIGLVGDRVKTMSAESKHAGLNLFIYELVTDRRDKKADETESAAPLTEAQKQLFIPIINLKEHAILGRERGPGGVPTEIRGVCREVLPLDGAETAADVKKENRTPEHADLCSCAEVAHAAESYFRPGYSRADEAGPVAVAKLAKGVFGILDNIFGILGKKIRENRIRSAVYDYLTDTDADDDAYSVFHNATDYLREELNYAHRAKQLESVRAYYSAYCRYGAARRRLVNIIRGQEPADPTNPPQQQELLCRHVEFQQMVLSAADEKSSKSPTTRYAAIDKAHSEVAAAIDDVLKSSALFDAAFDSPSGKLADDIEKHYAKLLKAADRNTKNPDWIGLADEVRWWIDLVIAAGKAEEDFDKLRKEFKSDDDE